MEATHFIEVYKHKNCSYMYTQATPIYNLEFYLVSSTYSKGKTIAIFKIKLK